MNDEQSPTIGALAKALAAAQGVMGGAKKDRENPAFRSKYADLSSVWDACREALSKNGLAVVQTTEPQGMDGVCVVTTLAHESGEWMRGKMFIPATKKDAHGFGSAVTYARRFALAAIVGIAPEDDDANAATIPKQGHGPIRPPPPSREQQAEQLPKQLAASIEVLELAEKIRKRLASAKTIGELRETWLDYNENVDAKGWPKKLLDGLLLAKDTRKLQLANDDRAAE